MKKIALLTLILSFLLGLSPHALADIVVIVNVNAPVSKMSREQVANVFLGRSNTFPNGDAALPVEQLEASKAYLDFHQLVTGKNLIQLKAFWAKMVFSGKASPPRELDADSIKKFVANNTNAIGYIDRSAVDNTVKIILQ